MAGSRTPKARALGAALRTAREEIDGMSQRKLAQEIGRDPGLLSRWESGERLPKPADVSQILAVLRVTGKRHDEIMSMTEGADGPRWLALNLPEQRAQLAALLVFEKTATRVTDVAPLLIPGVLQIEDYTRAIMESGNAPRDEIETRVAVRVARRRLITRPNPANLIVFLGEAALRQIIGSRTIMAQQLRYVLELSELPNVHIQVLPYTSGHHPGLETPFFFLETEDGPVVHIELRETGLFLHDPYDIQVYQQAIDAIAGVAMGPEVSAELITTVIKEMETTT